MTRILNIDETNLSITMKVADLKALFYEWEDERAKKLAEAKKEMEKQEWYNSRDTAKMFNKSISTINRWKRSGYLTARTVGGMDYYSKKEIVADDIFKTALSFESDGADFLHLVDLDGACRAVAKAARSFASQQTYKQTGATVA